MLPYLKGQKVFGYVDNSIHQPAKTTIASDCSTFPHLSYTNRETQDNLIFSCTNSSLSDEVLAEVAHYSTSSNIWMAPSSAFALITVSC